MNSSEILYLYDAKLANPNGDPDEENRPRMDEETNLVTDLRLKRYIRDYFLDLGKELYVQRVQEKTEVGLQTEKPVTAEKRVTDLKLEKPEEILKYFIDVRLFGATMPIKKNNLQFTGPLQFNWGYSLNKVEVMENSITSTFLSGEKNTQGAIGKDYRVKYSLIAFSGVISGRRAEKTLLQEEDITLMDQALKYAIPQQATRSKIGQYPRLYMRVEYKDKETVLGDYRSYIELENKEDLSDISQVSLKIDRLVEFLEQNKDKIEKIYYFCNTQLTLKMNEEKINFEDAMNQFTLCEIG